MQGFTKQFIIPSHRLACKLCWPINVYEYIYIYIPTYKFILKAEHQCLCIRIMCGAPGASTGK